MHRIKRSLLTFASLRVLRAISTFFKRCYMLCDPTKAEA